MKEDRTGIRRKDNKALPELQEAGSKRFPKDTDYTNLESTFEMSKELHKGGAIVKVGPLPEDWPKDSWGPAKGGMRDLVGEKKKMELPEGVKTHVSYCSQVQEIQEGEKKNLYVYGSFQPFDLDLKFFKQVKSVNCGYKSTGGEEKEADVPMSVVTDFKELSKVIDTMPTRVQGDRRKGLKNKARQLKAKAQQKLLIENTFDGEKWSKTYQSLDELRKTVQNIFRINISIVYC